MKKKLSLILACIMVVGLLGGCGNSFDASAYLKALLDNSYKNDSTQVVAMKIATAEEAAEVYEQGIDAEMNAMLYSIGSISEEQEEQYRQAFADIYAGAKYTVGEAKKQDDGSYVVTVTYEQMNIFGPTLESYLEKVEVQKTEWENAEETPSYNEQMDWLIVTLKDCIVESLENVTYKEAQTTTVRIEIVDNVWTPNQSDIIGLEEVLFDINEVSGF